jgi:type IV secretion system protein VirB11
MNTDALSEYLKPINPLLDDPEISEISINQPKVAYIEKAGQITEIRLIQLTHYWLEGLVNLIARFTEQRLSGAEPLLSAALPNGQRIQIVLPPACESGKIIISIRKQVIQNLSLEDYQAMGAFNQVKVTTSSPNQYDELLLEKKYCEFLKQAIQKKKNILISGATATGKTTFLNACLKEIPNHERIITLEDVREIQIPHTNKVHLLASKGEQGSAKINMPHLIEACLRLRPDRIILGEMRGAEAADFINATATGHDGALSTIHASSPKVAFMRLVHMAKLKPGMNLSREDILADFHSLIDIVVQISRIRVQEKYIRFISEIYYHAK